MSSPPGGRTVACPSCNADAIAIVPQGSTIVQDEAAADGTVWVTCDHCGRRFLVYFREQPVDDGD